MAISFVAAGTEASGTSGTSVTPALPAGIATDDILIVAASCYYGEATGSMNGSWTREALQNADFDFPGFAVFWRRYDDTDPSRAVTFSSSSGDPKIAGIFSVRGCKKTGSPFNGISTVATGTDNTIEHNSITTNVDNCLLLCINGTDGATTRSALASGFTNIFEDTSGGVQNAYTATDVSIHASYKDQGTQGSTGSLVVTGTSVPGWASVLMALEPEPAGGPLEVGRVHLHSIGDGFVHGNKRASGLHPITRGIVGWRRMTHTPKRAA